MLLFFSKATIAQHYQTGDLLFQNLDCGELCEAIEKVTVGYQNQAFSHIGLVYIEHDSVFVIEAIGKDVHLSSIEDFLGRSKQAIVQGRLKPQYQSLIPKAIQFALAQKGVAYDEPFIYDNGKYYCSELIYDAFLNANNGHPFFTLEPMTFKLPGTDQFFPVWKSYYQELGLAIPEGYPGINPGGISRSDKLNILNGK
jgi:Permuted papain-like amidase enzyme, YaeF/YiiX, C92 family